MVSPRPSCISWPVSRMASPPSWRMAMSKETRVRVDGLSKIMASVRPSSGFGPSWRRAFMARLASIIPRSSCGGMSIRSRKWRRPLALIRLPPLLWSFLGLGNAGAGPLDAPDRLGHFVLAHDQRRQQPYHVVTGRDGDHLLRPQLVDEIGARHYGAQADEEPFATQFSDDRGIAILDLGEPLLEDKGNTAHALEEAVGEHHVEQRAGRRHRQRIAAKSRAVRTRGHALRGLGGCEAGPDGEATAEGLGQRHDVGGDAAALIGEEFPGASDPGLHLVEHQQQAIFVA